MISYPGRWAYRALLRTLPRHFREAHGSEMEALFQEGLQACARQGRWAWLVGWLRGAADVVNQAVRLRRRARRQDSPSYARENIMESLLQDLRFAARSLAKAPGYTAVAVLTLALGIGANTAIFSLVNAVLLRPPAHIEAPEELVSIFTSDYSGPRFGMSSYMDYEEFRTRTPALADAAIISPGVVSLAGDDGISRSFISEYVSGNYFDVLGTRVANGRAFTAEEGDYTSGAAVAVMGHGLWTREFGSRTDIVGRTVRLSGQTVTIVGVAPEGFNGSLPVVTTDFWLPVSTQVLIQGEDNFTQRGNRGSMVRARLADPDLLETAQQQLTALAARLHEEAPGSWSDVREEVRRVTVVKDARIPPQLAGAVTGFAALLLATVVMVLLIACANVANVTLARAAGRKREMAVRLSLGAGRIRVARQLLSESLLVGTLGGLAGLAIAVSVLRMAGSIPAVAGVSIAVDLGMDGTVLLFSGFVTMLTVVAVGLLPALRASRPDLVPALKEGSEASRARFRWFHLRNLLVVSQVMASLILLVGAGLFIKSLRAAVSVDPGFTSEGLATMSLSLGPEGYSVEEAGRFFEGLKNRVSGLPGVDGVTVVDALPMTLMAGRRASLDIPGYTPSEGEDMEFQFFSVGPDFVSTMGMTLLAGRGFTQGDHAEAPFTIVVNESLAERLWPGESPLGQVVRWGGGHEAQVVGLVADAMYRSLQDTDRPAFFLPLAQNPATTLTLVARTSEERVADLLGTMRDEVRAQDARLTGIASLESMEDAISFTLLPQRIASWLLSLAGALGLLLATVGLYGVMSFLVAQRMREVGVRMALGAQAVDVIRMIVGRGVSLAVVETVAGLAVAAGVTRFLQALLFGVSPLDVTVFGVMGGAVVTIAALATYLPARRAATVDPAVTLRQD